MIAGLPFALLLDATPPLSTDSYHVSLTVDNCVVHFLLCTFGAIAWKQRFKIKSDALYFLQFQAKYDTKEVDASVQGTT